MSRRRGDDAKNTELPSRRREPEAEEGESERERGEQAPLISKAAQEQEEESPAHVEEKEDGDNKEEIEKPKSRFKGTSAAAEAASRKDEANLAEMEEGGGNDTVAKKKEKVNIAAPLTVLEPHRTDPMLNLRQRHKKLERATASNLPELHFTGQLVSGQGMIQDSTEGCCCRYCVLLHAPIQPLTHE